MDSIYDFLLGIVVGMAIGLSFRFIEKRIRKLFKKDKYKPTKTGGE